MYDSGTPTVCLGWARPSFQAKKSRCSGTSIGTHYAKTTYAVCEYPYGILEDLGISLTPKP